MPARRSARSHFGPQLGKGKCQGPLEEAGSGYPHQTPSLGTRLTQAGTSIGALDDNVLAGVVEHRALSQGDVSRHTSDGDPRDGRERVRPLAQPSESWYMKRGPLYLPAVEPMLQEVKQSLLHHVCDLSVGNSQASNAWGKGCCTSSSPLPQFSPNFWEWNRGRKFPPGKTTASNEVSGCKGLSRRIWEV